MYRSDPHGGPDVNKMTPGLTLDEFRHVRARIQPYIRTTPIVSSEIPNLFLKLENLQYTHSFKIRGAFARILDLVESGDTRRLLTVSAGNHGQAVARAASTFKLPCTVVVPTTAPKAKIEGIEKYGVDLRLEGANYDEAEAWTLRMAQNTNDYAFVSPYNDDKVILGQGTLAFEILEQLPGVSAIVVPIGGGGMAAGVSAVIKQIRPSVRVIGVQAEASAAIYHSLKAGRMVTVPDLPSIADGIAGNVDLQTVTFPFIQKHVDDVVLVSEAEIQAALMHLLQHEKLLVEGAAAAAFAAAGKIPRDAPVAAIMSGGNIDLQRLV
jgi:threonine dehydratase